ncbi:MAG: SDR family NAD(P)-dependent oxidoreductase [Paracoccaceae bacterium]
MSISLSGKTAIVTTATQDAGQTISQRFLDAGANVMIAACDDKGGVSLDGDDDRWQVFPFVMQDKLCIANLMAATMDRFGKIDVLVNGAQRVSDPGMFLEIGTENFDTAFGETVRNVFQLSQAFAKRMLDAEDGADRVNGAIVNVSSIAARRTVPELLSYSVSCAALDQLTRSMAASLAPRGIRVNAVALGGVMTERLRSAFREDETLRGDMLAVTPMGRLADTEEAAETALFLASDHASYITGQIVSVDGGRTLLDPLASPVR